MTSPQAQVGPTRHLFAGICALSLCLCCSRSVHGQVYVYIPETFGVIDVVPTSESGETGQHSEPSLALGVGAQAKKVLVRSFYSTGGNPNSPYFTSTDNGRNWADSFQTDDRDGTVDWSAGGTAYLTELLPNGAGFPVALDVFRSADPTLPISFTAVAGAKYQSAKGVDQPWLRVLNVNGADHIYVGYNDFSEPLHRTARVRFSLNGGSSWNNTILEKVVPTAGQDSPAVRLAIANDGARVYGLFQRWKTNTSVGDFVGDVVLVRDDNSGSGGFNALPINGNGGNDGVHDTQVARGVVLPWADAKKKTGTWLGVERIGSGCDVAVNPGNRDQVYVAYTKVINIGGPTPVIDIQYSSDGGQHFTLVYELDWASSIPALAVSEDGSLGMLFASKGSSSLAVQFLKAAKGNFSKVTFRTLASFPNNNPVRLSLPYLGDYFALKAVANDFYGAFCASGDPQPGNFPSGVFYQRKVKLQNGSIKSKFWLHSAATLVDNNNNPIAPSIDPFYFYDYAARYIKIDVGNVAGALQLSWPALAPYSPQFNLEATPTLGLTAVWSYPTNASVIQTNGQFLATINPRQSAQFFRVRQNPATGQFAVFTASGDHGSLSPDSTNGVLLLNASQSQSFTATADADYGVGNWYLDGVVVQSNTPTLTVSNVLSEHTLLATFAANYDVAVTLVGHPDLVAISNSLDYVIEIENTGLNPVSGVTMTNVLDPTFEFVSATNSHGSVSNFGNIVTADLGTLNPGALAIVTITVVPDVEGQITNEVSVGCNEFEPELSNNLATEVTTILTPVTIVTQPASQTVGPGGTATFSVDVSGTPPFVYQWAFNDVDIPGATNSTFIVSNVTTNNAGSYTVTVAQSAGPEEGFEEDSDPALLTVQ